MNDNVQEFLNLVKANPDLPIVPLVNTEVVGDDCCSSWVGSFGLSYIDEYFIGRERWHFKDDDEEDVLNDLPNCKYGEDFQGRDIYELSDEEWDALYKSLPWTKAIVVYIDTL